MTPSSLPLCASIGPRTTSPTAQTLPAPVWHSSSTLMKPRSSSCTPVPSPSSPSVNGRRPIATTTLSTVTVCSPLASVYFSDDAALLDVRAADLGAQPDVEALLPEVLERLLGHGLVGHREELRPWPRARRLPRRGGARRCRARARSRRRRSRRDASAPCRTRARPTNRRPALPSNGSDLSGMGCEPGASTTCFATSSRLLPSAAVNSTRLPASSRPWPCSAVTPAALNSPVMPCVEALTIAVLRFCMVATSKASPLALMPCAANSAWAR